MNFASHRGKGHAEYGPCHIHAVFDEILHCIMTFIYIPGCFWLLFDMIIVPQIHTL